MGYLASKKTKDSKEFFLSGRSLNLYEVTAVTIATTIGGAFAIGSTADIYRMGIAPAFWYIIGICIFCLWPMAFAWSKSFRDLNVTTVAEAIYQWYDLKTQTFSSFLNVVGAGLVAASQLVAAATVITTFIGVDFKVAYFITSIVIIIYVTAGGLNAVVYADRIQGVLLYAALIITGIVAISNIGGWSELTLQPNITPNDFNLMGAGLMLPFAYVLSNFLNSPTDQVPLMKAFAAKDANTGKWGLFLGGLIPLPALLAVLAIGLTARVKFPDIQPNMALPTLIINMYSPLIAGLFMVGVLAVVVSTAHNCLQACSTCLTVDFYKRFFNPEATEKQLLKFTRLFTVVTGAFALVVGVYMPYIIPLVVFAFGMRGAGFFLPIVLKISGIIINSNSAFWSSIGGGLTAIIWLLIGQPWGIHPVIPGVLVAAVVLIFVETLIRVKKQQTSDQLKV